MATSPPIDIPAARRAAAAGFKCPDCASELVDVIASPDGTRLSIITRHEETCPDPTAENIERGLMRRTI